MFIALRENSFIEQVLLGRTKYQLCLAFALKGQILQENNNENLLFPNNQEHVHFQIQLQLRNSGRLAENKKKKGN